MSNYFLTVNHLESFSRQYYKFPDPDTTVFISTTELEEVVIIVKDTGRGVSEEQLDKLYKVYRGKSSVGTFGENGNGLGCSFQIFN